MRKCSVELDASAINKVVRAWVHVVLILIELSFVFLPAGGSIWQRGEYAQLTVFENFTYSVVVPETGLELTQGLVGLRCGGQYQSSRNGGLVPAATQQQTSNKHARLGKVDTVSQQFVTAAITNNTRSLRACRVTASIHYLHEFDAFTFKLSFPQGAKGTLAYPTPKSMAANITTGLPLPGEWAGDAGGGDERAGDNGSLEPALPLGTHFPSFVVPGDLNFMATNGDLIAGNFVTDKMSKFAGGLGGGFLAIFNNTAQHPRTQQLSSIVLSPLTHQKAVYLSQAREPLRGAGPMATTAVPTPTGDRVSVGISGYIDTIPHSYEQEAVLSGRQGISAAYTIWGQVMQANGGSVKLSLEDDEYNSQARPPISMSSVASRHIYTPILLATDTRIRILHSCGIGTLYDGQRGYYCFCQVQPCQAASKVPMHVTINLSSNITSP